MSKPSAGASQALWQAYTGSSPSCLSRHLEAQGGDPAFLEDFSRLPQPTEKIVLRAKTGGTVAGLDALQIARAAKVLGAGRETKSELIDFGVGVVLACKIGDNIKAGDPLATLWVSQRGTLEAEGFVREAFNFSTGPIVVPALVETVETAGPISLPAPLPS